MAEQSSNALREAAQETAAVDPNRIAKRNDADVTFALRWCKPLKHSGSSAAIVADGVVFNRLFNRNCEYFGARLRDSDLSCASETRNA